MSNEKGRQFESDASVEIDNESLLIISANLAYFKLAESRDLDQSAQDKIVELANKYAFSIDLSQKQTINLQTDPFLYQESIPQELRDKLLSHKEFKDHLDEEISAEKVVAYLVFLEVNMELEKEAELLANKALGQAPQEDISELSEDEEIALQQEGVPHLTNLDQESQEFQELKKETQKLVNSDIPLENALSAGLVQKLVDNENAERSLESKALITEAEQKEILDYFVKLLGAELIRNKNLHKNEEFEGLHKEVIATYSKHDLLENSTDENGAINLDSVVENLNQKARKKDVDIDKFFASLPKEQADALLAYIKTKDQINKNDYILTQLKDSDDYKTAIIAMQNGGEVLEEFFSIYGKGYEGKFKFIFRAIKEQIQAKEQREKDLHNYTELKGSFSETMGTNKISREDILKEHEEELPELLKRNILDPDKTTVSQNASGDLLINFNSMENVEVFIPNDLDSTTNPMRVITNANSDSPIIKTANKEDFESIVDTYNAKLLAQHYKLLDYFGSDRELIEFFNRTTSNLEAHSLDNIGTENDRFLVPKLYIPYLDELFKGVFGIKEANAELNKDLFLKYNLLENGLLTEKTLPKFYEAKIAFDKTNDKSPTIEELEEGDEDK